MNLEFNTRDEYKQFVTEWKEVYKLLTQTIRTFKSTERNILIVCKSPYVDFRSDDGRFIRTFKNQKQTLYYHDLISKQQGAVKELQALLEKHNMSKFKYVGMFYSHSWKRLAKELLEMRKVGKVRSHDQWLKEKGLTPTLPVVS
jgi:hypothetical protein